MISSIIRLFREWFEEFKCDCCEDGFFSTASRNLFLFVLAICLTPIFIPWIFFESLNEWSKTWFQDKE